MPRALQRHVVFHTIHDDRETGQPEFCSAEQACLPVGDSGKVSRCGTLRYVDLIERVLVIFENRPPIRWNRLGYRHHSVK